MPVSPPRPKGPPLNALRAFEAAIRLGGFAQAADELCVTPGAISQHIKALEDWAEAPLFERRSQGVVPTEFGLSLAAPFATAFDSIGQAVRHLRSGAQQQTIHIAALPSVAQLWLSPRLPMIRTALAGHRLSVTALESPPNLQRELFDISIFLDTPTGQPGETILAEDTIFPVCSPEVAARLKSPEDLLNETWLYDAVWADDWDRWLAQAAPGLKKKPNGPHFSLYTIALEETKHSAGILIGHATLVDAALKAGDLVAPFGDRVTTGKALTVTVAPHQKASKVVRQVLAMLGGN